MNDLKAFFSQEDVSEIMSAVSAVESRSSGRVMVRVEKKAGRDALLRARAAFVNLGLDSTPAKNAVLFFISVEDRKFAVIGDDGINEKVPPGFWEKIRDAVLVKFRQKQFGIGVVGGITLLGEQLANHFPAEKEGNPLPDGISYEE